MKLIILAYLPYKNNHNPFFTQPAQIKPKVCFAPKAELFAKKTSKVKKPRNRF